jgi:hypothetical protein
MAQTFDIPVDVPWTLVAVSPDMMDTTFCDEGYPPPWRSSLAIYAFEPSPGDLPQQLCDQKITYLKVTCSVTGFQPTQQETQELSQLSSGALEEPLPTTPGDVPEDFVDPYFACYGALLNVAVFPSTTTIPCSSTATPTQYNFGKQAVLPNPFSVAGLQFSMARGANLSVRRIPARAGGVGLYIESNQLQIDLPVCNNVVLKMWNGPQVKGTIAVNLLSGAPLSIPLTPTNGVQNIPIPTSATDFVTQIVINETGDNCFLLGLSYSVGDCPVTLADYPHIIDFEPKTRDLYQAATDQGEILTASNSGVSTGKSFSTTASTEMGLGLNANVQATVGVVSASVGGELTSKWGNTTTDGSTTQIDNSRERRETQSTTTNITQQYNMLTGYHAGTNRAAFLMLPRPHTLQATDYRTFIRGLRMIEGVQEFFLIVSRPAALPGLCVEASLETGHFPETVALVSSASPPPISQGFPFSFTVGGQGGDISHSSGITYTVTQQFTLDPGWTLDTSKGNWKPGVDFLGAMPIPGDTTTSPEFLQATQNPNYPLVVALASSDQHSVSITGSCKSGGPPPPYTGSGTPAWVELDFTVYGTQPAPPPADPETYTVAPFLVTSRDLCVCLNSCAKTNCIRVIPPQQVPYGQSVGTIASRAVVKPTTAAKAMAMARYGASKSSVVYEDKVKIPRLLVTPTQLGASRTPAARELMYQIRQHMLNSWRRPQRRPHGLVGFVESDYVRERLIAILPKAQLSVRIRDVKGLPKGVVQALGAKATVGDVLKLGLHQLSAKSKLGLEDAIGVRRALLGFSEKVPKRKK